MTPPKEEPQTRRPVISRRGIDVERLALAGHAGDGAQPPAHARGFDGFAHHGHQAGGLERVVGAEAAGRLEHALDGVLVGVPAVGRALPARELQALLGEVDADDPLGALQATAGDRAEPDHAGAEHHARRARLHGGGVHRGAQPGREPAGEQAGSIQRRLAD